MWFVPGGEPVAQTAADSHDQAFRRISEILLRRRGLDLRGYKARIVTRRILTRVRALRLDDLDQYASHLAGHQDETDHLLAAVTINVSEFFRNATLFAMLGRQVIPELLESRRGRPVRAWCAGCATGEEVYSLAMLFRRVAGDRARPVSILGTDIDARALEEATRGVYPRERMRQVLPDERQTLFEDLEDELRVGPSLRALIRFEQANLLRDPPPEDLDLVFCRNLLIFLGEREQERALDVFRRALRDEGILVLGAVERVPSSHAEIFRPVDRRHRVYRHHAATSGGADR
jgi:chemotaxis methyl-accepting protein methylase